MGALPTGSNADYMTPFDGSIVGAVMSGLNTRDQDTVTAQEKANLQNGTYKTQSDLVFAGLSPALGLVGGIVKLILSIVVGTPLNILEGGLNAILGIFRGIPTSMITNEETQNLLANPQFTGDLLGWEKTGDWLLDITEGHTAMGAAHVEGNTDNTDKFLTSQNIPVDEDQVVTVSGWRKVANGVGVASPVRITLEPLDSDGIPTDTTVTIGATSASGNLDWAQITGDTYTVPAGVKFVRINLVVESTLTGGEVWFDDISLTKHGNIPKSYIGGLLGTLDNIAGMFGINLTDLDGNLDFGAIWSSVVGLFINPLGVFANLIGGLIPGLQIPGLDASKIISGSFPQSIVSGLTGALSDLNSAFNQIGDIVNGAVVTPISSAIGAFSSWFQGLLGWQHKTETNQVNAQNFQISVVAAGGYRNPAWVCRYPIGDVAYPEIFNAKIDVFGTTDSATTGTSGTDHTHTLSLTDDAYALPANWSQDANCSQGAIITISNSTIMDTVAMMLGKTSSAAMDNVYIEVFRLAADGSCERVFVSADVSSLLSASQMVYVEVPLSASLIVNAGERYLVRLRNSSTVGNFTEARGIRNTGGQLDIGMRTLNATDTNKTSYTAAEMTTFLASTDVVPWAMLAAKNLASNDQSYSDDFNRTQFGSLWVPFSTTGSTQLRISNNKADYNGSSNGIQGLLYARRTSFIASRVEADLSLTNGTSAREGVMLHCDRDLTQQVYLAVNPTNAKIYSGAPTSMTERASHATGGSGTWALYYDEVNDKYVAEKEGVPTGLEWTGVGTAVQHGVDYQYGGLRIEKGGGGFNFTAGSIDNWTLRDWKPETP